MSARGSYRGIDKENTYVGVPIDIFTSPTLCTHTGTCMTRASEWKTILLLTILLVAVVMHVSATWWSSP